MPELTWEGKYDANGKRVAPIRVSLPFQTVETVNESAQQRQQALDFFAADRETEWRNRLIWGDKKYVLPALLEEFAGSVDLIYIDPPFATGDDFSFSVRVPDSPDDGSDSDDVAFIKEPGLIEQKAYRDTWGLSKDAVARGATRVDAYLRWISDTALLLRDLLSSTGSLYVHLDWRVSQHARLVLDEIFGSDRFQNEIAWCYREAINSTKRWNRKHDTILFYTKSPDQWCFNSNDVLQPHSPATIAKYKYQDDVGRYRLMGRGITGSPIRSARDVSPEWERTSPELVYRHYLRNGTYGVDYWNIDIINQAAAERTAYPTQKPEALLERILKASSKEGDLVLDCFAGSGTTAVTAEKLGRRWIAADLGRFAVHTTRKRLLTIPDVRPFVVQNLGKYERQLWQSAEFGESAAARTAAYREFILDLYNATPLSGYSWLHGLKGGRMVHIGTVDAPVTVGDVTQIVTEFRRALGTGANAPTSQSVDVLGWDFAFELNEVARQNAERAGIALRLMRIPREVLEKSAVEQGDIKFFELAALSVAVKQTGRKVSLTVEDFVIPLDDVPADVQKAVTHWSQWIDYWAVDWDNKSDTFHNEWQTYRTRKDTSLELSTGHDYTEPGDYTVVVKVIDILGNDTTKTITVKVAGRAQKGA